MRNLIRLVTTAAAAALLSTIGLITTPASACTAGLICGELTNNSRMNVRIANCWPADSPRELTGDKLSCVTHVNRSDWATNADFELPPGKDGSDYSGYRDVDAVRFYKGCVTKWHYWGNSTNTADRRGKSSLWKKFLDIDHVYITSITC